MSVFSIPTHTDSPVDMYQMNNAMILHWVTKLCLFFLFIFSFSKFIYFNWRLIILQYCSGFAIYWHESATGVTWVLHPEPPSPLLPHPIPLGHPSAPAPSTMSHALNLDWRFLSHMIIYIFQCHFPKSSHPRPLPESKRLFCTSVSLLLSSIQGYRYHLSKFHIYALVYWGDGHGIPL